MLFPLLPLFEAHVEAEIQGEVGEGSIQGNVLRQQIIY